MPIFITLQELYNFSMFFMGIVSAWAVIKGLSDD